MYEGARDHLCEGGAFYIVIMKKHGAESTVKKLRTIFGTVDVIYKKSGSFVVKCMN
jgi:16S rRNA (guanine1207-N2)-methyltransferase